MPRTVGRWGKCATCLLVCTRTTSEFARSLQLPKVFVLTLTFSSRPEMNNVFNHGGSPALSLFSCDASAAVGTSSPPLLAIPSYAC